MNAVIVSYRRFMCVIIYLRYVIFVLYVMLQMVPLKPFWKNAPFSCQIWRLFHLKSALICMSDKCHLAANIHNTTWEIIFFKHLGPIREITGAFDLKQPCAEWSLYDINVPRERRGSNSSRSRDILMSFGDHSAQRCFSRTRAPNEIRVVRVCLIKLY